MSGKRNSRFRKTKARREMKKRPPASPPAKRDPTYDDILAIARLVESGSRFTEFRLRSGDIEVEVKRGNGAAAPAAMPAAAAPPPPQAAQPQATPQPVPAAVAADIPSDCTVIRSPMVGTFYRAPNPGAKPFVEVGSKVKPDTILCIIEVMKLMNSVTAGVAGTVTHVLVENAQTVEPGQALIAVRPA
jgi:acetyl-CoA carboxylase biotin carboxyl carrier protein